MCSRNWLIVPASMTLPLSQWLPIEVLKHSSSEKLCIYCSVLLTVVVSSISISNPEVAQFRDMRLTVSLWSLFWPRSRWSYCIGGTYHVIPRHCTVPHNWRLRWWWQCPFHCIENRTHIICVIQFLITPLFESMCYRLEDSPTVRHSRCNINMTAKFTTTSLIANQWRSAAHNLTTMWQQQQNCW